MSLIVSLLATFVVAPACTAPEYHQFDFWLGRWTVTANGQFAGTNAIDRPIDGCALQEHWVGAHGTHGTSLNIYDATRKRWHQTWVDDQGLLLQLDGAFADGQMTMTGTTLDAKGATVLNRITWRIENGDASRVRQVWSTSTDDGKTWVVGFDGHYTRQ